MSDEFQIVPYQVRSAGTDVPPEEVQRGLNSLAFQTQVALNSLAGGGGTIPSGNVTYTPPGTGGVSTTVSNELGKTLYVSDYDTVAHAVAAGLNNRLVIPQGTTVVVNVPSAVATVTAAMSAIANWEIFGVVNIQVSTSGTSEPAGVTLAHPFGENINVFGPTVTPGGTPTATVNFAGTSGFYVPRGFTFGAINYLNINNTGAKGLTLGVYSDGGKIAAVGPTLRINSFYYGVASRFGAYINANGTGAGVGTIVSGAGDASFWAYAGTLECQWCNGSGANDSGNNLGTAFVCEFGGSMDATNSTGTGCFLAGYGVLSNGAIRGWGITSSTNGNGINLVGGGVIEVFPGAAASVITNNTGFGYISDGDGIVDGWSTATVSGNTAGDHSITARPLVISGGTITGGTIDNTPIGNTTRATGKFTTLNANGLVTLDGAGPEVLFNVGGPNIRVPATNVLRFNNGVSDIFDITSAGLVPAQTTGIVGTTTNNNANAGSVGEFPTPTNLSGVSLTTAAAANVSSVSLTAGDWDVTGVVSFTPAGGTSMQGVTAGISTTSATFGAAGTFTGLNGTLGTGVGQNWPAPVVRLSLAATTTVYMVASAGFTSSTCTASGFLRARRIR